MMPLLILAGLVIPGYFTGLNLLRILQPSPVSKFERYPFATTLGLGVFGYTLFGLGCLRMLSTIQMALGLAGVWVVIWAAARKFPPLQSPDLPGSPLPLPERRVTWILLSLTSLCLAMSVVGSFVPPGAFEWDALSYHLAAPKVYLLRGGIEYIPTDHHSNFPFLLEMLFMAGLRLQGFALANLMHWVFLPLTALAAMVTVDRNRPTSASALAAFAVCSVPIIMWEASAAYIDLGVAATVTLAVAAALRYRSSRSNGWLRVSGACMGLALGMKLLCLLPFLFVWALLISDGLRFKQLRWYAAFTVLFGSPFYIKSAVLTGNPVYPFFSKVFPSRDWSPALEEAYNTEQRSFGLNDKLESVADEVDGKPRLPWNRPSIPDRIRNAAITPFMLTSRPNLFNNPGDPRPQAHLGFLVVCLAGIGLVAGAGQPTVKLIGGTALLWLLAWTQVMQHVRYIIPLVPLAAVLGSQAAAYCARRSKPVLAAISVGVLLQFALSASVFAPGLSEQLQRATSANAQTEYLRRSVNSYAATQWINENTPRDSGVVLFEDTRGFYLDRRWLWGNMLHSLFIPYETMADGEEMADWFLKQGVKFALINLQFAPAAGQAGGMERLKQAVSARGYDSLVREWYPPQGTPGERWRRLVGDAISAGRLHVRSDASATACVVLEFVDRRR